MKQKKAREQHLREAAEALSDLNTFAIVATILEGGHTHAFCQSEEFRIIHICRGAQQKLLRSYDKAMAAANAAES